MALYYNLSKLNEKKKSNSNEVKNFVEGFVFLAETKLTKLEKAISKKKYDKVVKHVSKLKKFLVLFDMDECVEYTDAILIWADEQGPRKTIDEVFKVYKIRVEKALKEMKKDFKIVLEINQ